MVVDIILDRKDGYGYDPKELYEYCTDEINVCNYEEIARALDSGENKDVQKALCNYINMAEYNPAICDYINSEYWI